MSRMRATQQGVPPAARVVPQPAAPRPVADSTNWLEITCGIRDGDEQSFRVLFDRFSPSCLRLIKQLTQRDEATCLDLHQECMLKIIRSVKPIASEHHLAAWLRAVVRSVTFDWLRKQQRSRENTLDMSQDPASESRSDSLDTQARLAWIEEQLQCLPEEIRRLFGLRFRMGWTLKRIATRTGLKTGAVDGKIRRVIDKLKQQAKIDFDEGDWND